MSSVSALAGHRKVMTLAKTETLQTHLRNTANNGSPLYVYGKKEIIHEKRIKHSLKN